MLNGCTLTLLPGWLWTGEHPGLVLLQLHQSLCQHRRCRRITHLLRGPVEAGLDMAGMTGSTQLLLGLLTLWGRKARVLKSSLPSLLALEPPGWEARACSWSASVKGIPAPKWVPSGQNMALGKDNSATNAQCSALRGRSVSRAVWATACSP